MDKQRNRLATTIPLVIAILLASLPSIIFAASAASPTFTLTAKTDKSAYYIGEDFKVTVTLAYKNIAQNYTVDFELWNATASVKTLINDHKLDYTNGGANGTYEPSAVTVSGHTNKTGTYAFTVKVIDTVSLLTISSAQINVVVQERNLYLSVSWVDQNQDRTIGLNEQVTFTAYTTYSFANESDSLSLYVLDQAQKQLIDTVSISAGSGQVTDTYITTFATAGSYTLKFSLENSEGAEKKSTSVQVKVGETTTTTTQVSWTDQIMQGLYTYRYFIITGLIVAIVAAVVVKYR